MRPKFTFIREEGQGLLEYALVISLIAVVVLVAMWQMGPAINQQLCLVAGSLQKGVCGPIWSVGVDNSGPVTIVVEVAETVDVTVSSSAGSVSPTSQACNGTCTFTVTGASSGDAVVSAPGSPNWVVRW